MGKFSCSKKSSHKALRKVDSRIVRTFSLNKDVISVGRAKDADMLTPNSTFSYSSFFRRIDSSAHRNMISRKHAEIRRLINVEDGTTSFTIYDLNSKNGIVINQKRVDSGVLSYVSFKEFYFFLIFFREHDNVVFGGANGIPVGSFVSHPNCELVYEFLISGDSVPKVSWVFFFFVFSVSSFFCF